MTKYLLFSALLSIICISLNALEIVNSKGISKEFDNAILHKQETQELKTHKEKDGEIRLGNWRGFRFDVWLKQQDLGDFNNIRFESADRYLVNLSREEFDNMETWIVTSQDDIPFENNALRLIIPSMREMYWIRNLQRIVLENFVPLPQPTRFYLMKPFLSNQKLYNEPKPFVNIEGYYFSEFLPKLSPGDKHQIILCSSDGLKQNLDYPLHLEGAVLEKTQEGTYNLKSPQIPGGMWIRDVIYLQSDNMALIDQKHINSLINLAKLLGWESNPELSFHIYRDNSQEVLNFGDALAEPQVFEGALYFELF
jgi:hypothetical protein